MVGLLSSPNRGYENYSFQRGLQAMLLLFIPLLAFCLFSYFLYIFVPVLHHRIYRFSYCAIQMHRNNNTSPWCGWPVTCARVWEWGRGNSPAPGLDIWAQSGDLVLRIWEKNEGKLGENGNQLVGNENLGQPPPSEILCTLLRLTITYRTLLWC